jgi:hypothetical protein
MAMGVIALMSLLVSPPPPEFDLSFARISTEAGYGCVLF